MLILHIYVTVNKAQIITYVFQGCGTILIEWFRFVWWNVHKSTAAMNYLFSNMTNTVIFMTLTLGHLRIRHTTVVPMKVNNLQGVINYVSQKFLWSFYECIKYCLNFWPWRTSKMAFDHSSPGLHLWCCWHTVFPLWRKIKLISTLWETFKRKLKAAIDENIPKGNNKITELRTILQRESQNS
jgi:hypothetical protein